MAELPPDSQDADTRDAVDPERDRELQDKESTLFLDAADRLRTTRVEEVSPKRREYYCFALARLLEELSRADGPLPEHVVSAASEIAQHVTDHPAG